MIIRIGSHRFSIAENYKDVCVQASFHSLCWIVSHNLAECEVEDENETLCWRNWEVDGAHRWLLRRRNWCMAWLVILKIIATSLDTWHVLHVPLKIILSITPHGGAYNQWCRKSLLSPCPVPVVTTPTFADIWLDGIVCIWMIYTAILALNMWGPAWTSSDIAWLHRYTQLENITPISSGQFHLDDTSNPLDQINWVVIYQIVFGWYLRWLEPICSNNFLETSQSAILGWCTIYSQLCTIYYNNALFSVQFHHTN